MTDRPDRPDDSENPEPGGDRGLDVDAAFEAIVANFGPTIPPGSSTEPDPPVAESGPPVVDSGPPVVEPVETRTPDPGHLRGLFRPAWDDPIEPDDVEHFVPPPPPPIPTPEPRRKIAWIGLFGGPALMLFAIVTGTALPGWIMFVLSAGFVGGFVYLVATMGDSGRGHWPGDDGAVV